MKILLLHNPTAGDGGSGVQSLIGRLRAAGHSVLDQESAEDALSSQQARDVDLVAISGGDGTVATVLGGATGMDTSLTILPTGTANNLAYALGIDDEVPAPAEALGGGGQALLRFGLADGPSTRQRFFESAGIGALAHALGPVNQRQVPSARKIPEGLDAFRRSVVEAPEFDVTVVLDGVRTEERLILLEIANISRFGPKLLFAPAKSPGDDRFQIVTADAGDRAALLTWIDNRPDLHPAPVRIRCAQRIELQWLDAPWHLDDYFHAAGEGQLRRSLQIRHDPLVARFVIPGRLEQ